MSCYFCCSFWNVNILLPFLFLSSLAPHCHHLTFILFLKNVIHVIVTVKASPTFPDFYLLFRHFFHQCVMPSQYHLHPFLLSKFFVFFHPLCVISPFVRLVNTISIWRCLFVLLPLLLCLLSAPCLSHGLPKRSVDTSSLWLCRAAQCPHVAYWCLCASAQARQTVGGLWRPCAYDTGRARGESYVACAAGTVIVCVCYHKGREGGKVSRERESRQRVCKTEREGGRWCVTLYEQDCSEAEGQTEAAGWQVKTHPYTLSVSLFSTELRSNVPRPFP